MTAPLIAAITGADGRAVQACLADFAARRAGAFRVVGVVEVFGPSAEPQAGKASGLRSLADGRSFALFQDLGPAAVSCSILPEGVIAAGEAVRAQIAGGCDVVVLSKFGKLEADNGSGLVAAFADALAAGVPILTSVSPRHAGAWERFAAPLYVSLPVSGAAVEQWWDAVRAR